MTMHFFQVPMIASMKSSWRGLDQSLEYYLVAYLTVGLHVAIAWAFLESAFTYAVTGTPKTTYQQFGANVLVGPLLVYFMQWTQEYPSYWVRHRIAGRYAVRVNWMFLFEFPIWMWLTQLLKHACLRAIYGFNPAWSYKGQPYARVDGAISLGCAPYWFALALVLHQCEVSRLMHTVVRPMIHSLVDHKMRE